MEHGWGLEVGLVELGRLFWLNFTSDDLKHEAISRIFEKGLNVQRLYQSVGVIHNT